MIGVGTNFTQYLYSIIPYSSKFVNRKGQKSMFITKKKLQEIVQDTVSEVLDAKVNPEIYALSKSLDSHESHLQTVDTAVTKTYRGVSALQEDTENLLTEVGKLVTALPEDRLAIAENCMKGISQSHNIIAGGIDRNNEVILQLIIEGHRAILNTLNLLLPAAKIPPPQPQQQQEQQEQQEQQYSPAPQPFQTIQEMAKAGGIVSTGQVKEQAIPSMTPEQFISQAIPNDGGGNTGYSGLSYDGNGMPMPIRKED